MIIYNFSKFAKSAILLVLLSAFNVKSADDSMILPYDESVADDSSAQQPETQLDQPNISMTTLTEANIRKSDPYIDDQDPFTEINLDPTSFRNAKTSHTNLIIALTQQEERDASNQISGGDKNSGSMRDVEQNVLSSFAQHLSDPDDPSKVTFIRLDVTKNSWIWDYFNDGTSAQSVDKNNGTPQYLFFNKGILTSVLIGNRDDSAFASWVRSNVEGQNTTPAESTTEAAPEEVNDASNLSEEAAEVPETSETPE